MRKAAEFLAGMFVGFVVIGIFYGSGGLIATGIAGLIVCVALTTD